MSTIRANFFCPNVLLPLLLLGLIASQNSSACTTAVISGKITHDGRPILWKNRDSSSRHNELILLDDGIYRALAVVNAGSRNSVWMGTNEAGFCIENSLSEDLGDDNKDEKKSNKLKLKNGSLLKLALQTCATVEDFEKLLIQTGEVGRQTNGNFGVIDAHGGAVIFEVSTSSHSMFDVNDPKDAPHGYLVRTNFATTSKNLQPSPKPSDLVDIYSSHRYAQACSRLDILKMDKIDVSHILRNMSRDLSTLAGQPLPGTVNGSEGELPDIVLTDNTISRTTTVSAAVFQGVREGENPLNTTMWTILGDPKFSIAVPCWVGVRDVDATLTNQNGADLGEIALTLRDGCLNKGRNGIRTVYLPSIWENLWRVEDQIFLLVSRRLKTWRTMPALQHGKKVIQSREMTGLHHSAAKMAMDAMKKELLDMKKNALRLDVEEHTLQVKNKGKPVNKVARIAIYDHSSGLSSGTKSVMRCLTEKNGFKCEDISPSEIRRGLVKKFDAIVLPGGSGSSQAAKLEELGKNNIKQFVRDGGGYIGICAGSYLASSHYDWSLGLINARAWDRPHWSRGKGMVDLRMTSQGQSSLGISASNVKISYAQGPLLVPDNDPDLSGYEVLARFDSEISKNGAQPGAMTGTHAIIRSFYGQGRVICFSPHPESLNGPNGLLIHGVRWAARRKK